MIDETSVAKKKKKNKRKKIILYACLGVCITAVVVCAVGLGIELYTGRKSIAYYSALSEGIEKRPRQTGSQGNAGRPQPSPPVNDGDDNDETDVGEPVFEADPWIPYVDFDTLNRRFPGIAAWIQLEGTLLDYPVMQGTNNYFYLSNLPDGTRDRAGSVFLDYRNSPDFSDQSSLLYGHESRVGEMFGVLKNFRTQSFYDEHPVINLYTQDYDYEIVLIAGYLVDSGVETPPLSFRDEAAFERYIAEIRRRSVFRSSVEVDADDRLVCLCTCAYDFTNARLVIVGKLVAVDGIDFG